MTELQEKLFDTMIQFTDYAGEQSTSAKIISGIIKEIIDDPRKLFFLVAWNVFQLFLRHVSAILN